MQLIIDLCLAASGLSLALLLFGLYKPWYMLWWEDRQNRLKVIKVYGSAAVFFIVTYEILSTIFMS